LNAPSGYATDDDFASAVHDFSPHSHNSMWNVLPDLGSSMLVISRSALPHLLHRWRIVLGVFSMVVPNAFAVASAN
jgi:hypothetical protein